MTKQTSQGKGAVSSAELLTLLRQPGSSGSRPTAFGSAAAPGGHLDAEFSRLYLSSANIAGYSSRQQAASDSFGMAGLAELVSQAMQGRLPGPTPFGLELRSAGLKMEQSESLSRSFASPWLDANSTANSSNHLMGHLESVLPACYSVQSSPDVSGRLGLFAEETLFYMFYAMPGDAMQEAAAGELYKRGWRFHKELKVWLHLLEAERPMLATPDLSLPRSSKQRGTAAAATGEAMSYTIFDPQSWTRISKELPVRPEQLEERSAASGTKGVQATPVLVNSTRS